MCGGTKFKWARQRRQVPRREDWKKVPMAGRDPKLARRQGGPRRWAPDPEPGWSGVSVGICGPDGLRRQINTGKHPMKVGDPVARSIAAKGKFFFPGHRRLRARGCILDDISGLRGGGHCRGRSQGRAEGVVEGGRQGVHGGRRRGRRFGSSRP